MRYVQLRNGIYFYRRRYPVDIQPHMGGTVFKVRSLKTKSAAEAGRLAKREAEEDDALWKMLRTDADDLENSAPLDVTRIAEARLSQIGIRPGRKPNPHYDPLGDFLDDKHGEARMEALHETGEPPDWEPYLDPVDKEMIRLTSDRPAVKRLSDALKYYLKEDPKRASEEVCDR